MKERENKEQENKEKENQEQSYYNKKNKKNNNINDNSNYDYIKKVRGNMQGLYGNNNYQDNNISQHNNNNRKYSNNNIVNDNDYDQEYEDLFHPKKNINNQLNTSDYSNSVYNLLNNLDNQNRNMNNMNNMYMNNTNNIIDYNNNYGYDDLINSINEPKINRINKRRINRNSKMNKNKTSKKNFLNSHKINDDKSYYLAPMKGIPITNISFRARMKYFSNKKEKNLEKLVKQKKEAEKEIYTFQPKTGDNSLNVIKYNNAYNEKNKSNNKNRKVDYDRINNLYLDYKDKKNKIDELAKEYYDKAGISFTPKISDKNSEIKKFKNKLGQIPYLDRIEIYNANKQPYKSERNIQFYQDALI